MLNSFWFKLWNVLPGIITSALKTVLIFNQPTLNFSTSLSWTIHISGISSESLYQKSKNKTFIPNKNFFKSINFLSVKMLRRIFKASKVQTFPNNANKSLANWDLSLSWRNFQQFKLFFNFSTFFLKTPSQSFQSLFHDLKANTNRKQHQSMLRSHVTEV